jgi:ectoine hydroxylase-related dioxygenase (phytanoyl-CoA dioxygenase family)
MSHVDFFQELSRDVELPPESAAQLASRGFVLIPGPTVPGGIEQVQTAFDIAVANADTADVRVSTSTRVTDFVNRSAEFDGLYIHPPLLAACCQVVGRPFKLSNTCARTLNPGAPAQELHVDVKYGAEDWPLLGYIWMIDAFDADNGATRFVPGSHLQGDAPSSTAEATLACGPAGSLIVFNGSVWHGHAANCSLRRRRSVQGHFVAREGFGAIDYGARMQPETLQRIGSLARYLLNLQAVA